MCVGGWLRKRRPQYALLSESENDVRTMQNFWFTARGTARRDIVSVCVCVYLGLMESRTRKGKFNNIVLMILSENWPVEPFNSITLFAFNSKFYLFISFTILLM